jgi:UDP-3-O-[3-hydroxymyristoyl] glucosamine N-acyltransferase
MKLREIALLLGGEVRGEPELEIKGVAGLEDAAEGDISYIADTKSISLARKSRASSVLVKEFIAELEMSQVQVANPQYAFAALLGRFHEVPHPPAGMHDLAFVADGATVSPDASIGAFAYISSGASVGARTVIYPGAFVGEGSAIGEDCLIYPNVVIREGVKIGNRVILQPGAVIGADGFGYVMHEGKHQKIPQVGGVIIGDDVEVGACTTIDRATTGNTVIGNGTKIDNLVQVAHNVSVGENAILVSQVGIAGSSKIGNSVVLGGQSGIADHVSIADGTMLAARSGVMSDLKRGVYSGAPAVPRREFMRAVSFLYKLPELNDRIKKLEEKLGNIERSRGDD